MDVLFSDVYLFNVFSNPLEQHCNWISFEPYPAYRAGLKKQCCVAFRHLAGYIFRVIYGETGTQLLWLIRSTQLLVQAVLELYCFPSNWESCVAGNSWWVKDLERPWPWDLRTADECKHIPGERAEVLWGKALHIKHVHPKELKVPAIIWNEAIKVPVSCSEDNDRNYSFREPQMFHWKKWTSLKLLSGK